MGSGRGFTLIELVLVMVLIAIVAIYAAPRMSSNIFDATAAARELLVAIRYTQEQSMNNSGAAPFEITITPSGFAITQGGNPVTNPLNGSNFTDQNWSGNGITTDTTTTLCFNARGRPFNSGCTTAATTPTTITITAGGDNITLTIEELTGYVIL